MSCIRYLHDLRVQSTYPSLYDSGTCSLLKPQLSTVHHRAKDSQASRINILTAVLDSCKEARREWIKKGREGDRERGEGGKDRERASEVILNFVIVYMHVYSDSIL